MTDKQNPPRPRGADAPTDPDVVVVAQFASDLSDRVDLLMGTLYHALGDEMFQEAVKAAMNKIKQHHQDQTRDTPAPTLREHPAPAPSLVDPLFVSAATTTQEDAPLFDSIEEARAASLSDPQDPEDTDADQDYLALPLAIHHTQLPGAATDVVFHFALPHVPSEIPRDQLLAICVPLLKAALASAFMQGLVSQQELDRGNVMLRNPDVLAEMDSAAVDIGPCLPSIAAFTHALQYSAAMWAVQSGESVFTVLMWTLVFLYMSEESRMLRS